LKTPFWYGPTRRQVCTHFVEVEQSALQHSLARRFHSSPLASGPSSPMATSKWTVRSIAVPLAILGQRVRVR
jgi:hypothetical protein